MNDTTEDAALKAAETLAKGRVRTPDEPSKPDFAKAAQRAMAATQANAVDPALVPPGMLGHGVAKQFVPSPASEWEDPNPVPLSPMYVVPPVVSSIKRSQDISKLALALAKAQGKIEAASKDRVNPHFGSRYATLASVWDACREQLSTAEIAVIQAPCTESTGDVTVVTVLAHSSGQWMESTLSARPNKADAQGIGSVITYLRRYSLSSMVGVAPEDDDDANAAVGGRTPQQRPAPPPRQPSPPPARPDPAFEARKNAALFAASAIMKRMKADGLPVEEVWAKHKAPATATAVTAANIALLEAAVAECERSYAATET